MAITAGLLFLFSAPVLAFSGGWQAELTAQTQEKSGSRFANMAGRGYTLADVAKTNVLDASSSEVVNISLPSGGEYMIMGVCDNDCSDLDLALLKDGVELRKDTTTDDWPLVSVTPTGSGSYQVRVTMYQCSTPNCGYQLTVWRKR
jgi:hypothetical protein